MGSITNWKMPTDLEVNETIPGSAEIQWDLESQGPYYFGKWTACFQDIWAALKTSSITSMESSVDLM